jgi:chromosome segregation ATPase
MYEDIIARLEQQNAALAEENLAAHLVNKEFADEVRELKQQLTEANAGIESISQHYREWVDSLEKENAELRALISVQATVINYATNTSDKLLKENAELREELDSANACNTALWPLAEERRVALIRCSPWGEAGRCYCCNALQNKSDTHKPDCDYVRLVKEDE